MSISGKAGCTLACDMFFHYIQDKEFLDFMKDKPKAHHGYIHYYRLERFLKKNLYTYKDVKKSNYTKIKFVRNPFTRLVSAYLYCIPKREFTHNVCQTLLLPEGSDLKVTFRQFVDFIFLYEPALENIHLVPQRFSLEPKELTYDYIIKLENLLTYLQHLRKSTKINFVVPNYEYNHHKIKQIFPGPNVSDVSYATLANKANIPMYTDFYDEQLYAQVYNIYQGDFELYGYPEKLF